jgi:S-methylmethionine-dependent homocysteine/selenocysteine methylase
MLLNKARAERDNPGCGAAAYPAGVQIVGGCCGTGPSHIRRLSGKLTYS